MSMSVESSKRSFSCIDSAIKNLSSGIEPTQKKTAISKDHMTEEKIDSLKTLTDNGDLTYASSGSAIVDLFVMLARNSNFDILKKVLVEAWKEDATSTMACLLYARDCRSGKGEKLVVYKSLAFLRMRKPRTYLMNLPLFVEVGYFKDLLLLTEMLEADNHSTYGEETFVELELLATVLREDIELMDAYEALVAKGEKAKLPSLSLASKWAPSEKKHFDKYAKVLAGILFRNDKSKKTQLSKYRKAMGRLRKHLDIVEKKMSEGKWEEISYTAVPAMASKNYRKAFEKHDGERYGQFINRAKEGKEKINTTGLQPHQLTKPYVTGYGKVEIDNTIEAQWKQLVDKVLEAGSLQNAVAMVDVSGSMSGTPMEVAVALGIVLSTITKGDFHKKLISFHSDPTWFSFDGLKTLRDQVVSIKNMPWGMNTNILAAFKMILDVAQKNNIANEDMPKSLYIFSDMQFDSADGGRHSSIETARELFRKAEYEFPQIVFWNIQGVGGNTSFPTTIVEDGVAMVSGFSAEVFKLFLEEGKLDTSCVVTKALSKYSPVVDEAEGKRW